jgi:hypothetical protein
LCTSTKAFPSGFPGAANAANITTNAPALVEDYDYGGEIDYNFDGYQDGYGTRQDTRYMSDCTDTIAFDDTSFTSSSICFRNIAAAEVSDVCKEGEDFQTVCPCRCARLQRVYKWIRVLDVLTDTDTHYIDKLFTDSLYAQEQCTARVEGAAGFHSELPTNDLDTRIDYFAKSRNEWWTSSTTGTAACSGAGLEINTTYCVGVLDTTKGEGGCSLLDCNETANQWRVALCSNQNVRTAPPTRDPLPTTPPPIIGQVCGAPDTPCPDLSEIDCREACVAETLRLVGGVPKDPNAVAAARQMCANRTLHTVDPFDGTCKPFVSKYVCRAPRHYGSLKSFTDPNPPVCKLMFPSVWNSTQFSTSAVLDFKIIDTCNEYAARIVPWILLLKK